MATHWSWHFYNDAHKHIMPQLESQDAKQAFSSQSDAETWLGEYWRQLRAANVVEVELTEDDQTKYTMSLAAAEQ
ncbi:MAG: hypothetical protein DLM55_10915 [Acidimicrobiales bacterium]|nr:MAG: hypothetical protein DLM55_10915 [Acidimicrobiales bacterium]